MTSSSQDWFRKRGYLHFDEPISVKSASELVTSPTRVASHSFWPLISYEIQTVKIRKVEGSSALVKKPKNRPIAYAAHSDSHIFSYYCQMLSRLYEQKVSQNQIGDSVLAFRPLGKNNIDFAKQAFDEIKKLGDCVAIALDITKFFDNLDHRILKQQWMGLLGVAALPDDHFATYKALTRHSSVKRDNLFNKLNISVHNPRAGRRRLCTPLEFRSHVRDGNLIETNFCGKGIPQGTAISAFLSNLYMFDFDLEMNDRANKCGGKYMRYCDDILFVVPNEHESEIRSTAEGRIRDLKLEVNPDKIDVCHFNLDEHGRIHGSKSLQYLGFLFDGQRIFIRSAAFAKFSNRMKRGVSLAKLTMFSENKARAEKGLPSKDLYLRKIYARYSHLGSRNFLRYGYRAAVIMNAPNIRKQLRPLWGRLKTMIDS